MFRQRPVSQADGLYFITVKAVEHANLFQRDVIKRLLLDTFDWYRVQKRMRLYGFVIMPNHFSWIAQFTADDPMDEVLRDLKRHVAERLVRQLKAEGNQKALDWLAGKAALPGKRVYKVWEDGYEAEAIASEETLSKMMDLMHNNPCQAEWKLSKTPQEYLWSSARFYLAGEPGIIPIDRIQDLQDGS